MKRKRDWKISVPNSSNPSVPSPPGFDFKKDKKENKEANSEEAPVISSGDILTKKAWDIAKSPIRQVFMYGIVAFFSGRGIGIIPLIMLGVQLYTGIMGVLRTNTLFREFKNAEGGIFLQKCTYFLLQCCIVGIGLFRLNRMGLLPTYGDWISTEIAFWPKISSISITE